MKNTEKFYNLMINSGVVWKLTSVIHCETFTLVSLCDSLCIRKRMISFFRIYVWFNKLIIYWIPAVPNRPIQYRPIDPSKQPMCQPYAGTITRPFSFEYTKYKSDASILPRSKSNRHLNINRIFGGRDATPGELPSHVNLLFGGTQLYNLLCGGTLISSTVSA